MAIAGLILAIIIAFLCAAFLVASWEVKKEQEEYLKHSSEDFWNEHNQWWEENTAP